MKEARRRRRRRWTTRLLIIACSFGGAAAVVVLLASGTRSRSAGSAGAAGVLPTGPLATLHVAGPLAVAPTARCTSPIPSARRSRLPGTVYWCACPTDAFALLRGAAASASRATVVPRCVPSCRACQISRFAPDGTLYIADGGRVRTVSPGGVIRHDRRQRRTAPANHQRHAGSVGCARSGGSPLHIALSPAGHLYISTEGRSCD